MRCQTFAPSFLMMALFDVTANGTDGATATTGTATLVRTNPRMDAGVAHHHHCGHLTMRSPIVAAGCRAASQHTTEQVVVVKGQRPGQGVDVDEEGL